jgi:GNAT superfamily N-acetyltransferase
MTTLETRPSARPRGIGGGVTSDEAALMPRYVRRAPAGRVHRAADDGRRRDAREVAMLDGQLAALARDIRSARSAQALPSVGLAEIMCERRLAPQPEPRGERVRLPGGREICIRAIEPADVPKLRAAFDQLSALTRYKRFLVALDRLSERQLRFLTRVDHADHEALVALDEASGGACIGVARYVRDAHDPRLAGVAVVVIDAWHRRGVASALLERLAGSARATGIERLTGSSILDDRAAAALAARGGAVTASPGRPGTTELTVRLAGRSATVPSASDLADAQHRRAGAPDLTPRRSSAVRGRGSSGPMPPRGRRRGGGDGRADRATSDRGGRPAGCLR